MKHQLVIFSDDWGRHPSSCQHLAARLVKRYPILWVNTIGMRSPTLSREDLGKAWAKLCSWISVAETTAAGEEESPARVVPEGMSVINPRMWPGFRRGWQRKLNAKLVAKAVNQALGPRQPGERRTVITTLPITADLPGKLDVDRWVYYCVDDFSVWPGLDASAMRQMEHDQLAKMDHVTAVSQTLIDRLTSMGSSPDLLTHGIDLDHWHKATPAKDAGTQTASTDREATLVKRYFGDARRPILLFWGLIDPRLDWDWCNALAQSNLGSLVLVGPQQSPDARLASLPGVHLPGPASYDDLPALARQADVLVMPYADLPVTRAMQPLKFKEYLATGKPVVARRLPGIVDWQDAADLVDDQGLFLQQIKHRLAHGLDDAQAQARRRLQQETWDHKADQFDGLAIAP